VTDPARVLVGYISRAHGLKGALRVHCESGDSDQTADSLKKAGQLWLDDVAYEIERARTEKEDVLVELAGVLTREASDALRGKKVYVERSALPEPDEDELYLADLVGCTVVSPGGETYGTVTGTYDSGAQDVLMIDTPKGEKLLPFVEPMLVDVDLEARRITYDAPPGMIDDDAEVAQ
jgi:16S rRNA processing protein RimM